MRKVVISREDPKKEKKKKKRHVTYCESMLRLGGVLLAGEPRCISYGMR